MAKLSRFAVLVLSGVIACVGISAWAADSRDHFKAGQSSVTFPVQIHGSLVYLPVEINGHHLQFSLDSGSRLTLVDSRLLKELNLRATDKRESLQGAGEGRVPMQAIGGLTLELPGLEVYLDQASATDLSPLNKEGGIRTDGIIGFALLSRYVATIDYEHSTLTLTDPEKFIPSTGAHALPIEIRHGWPFVRADVKPSEDVTLQDTFLIDSGSSDAVDHPVAKTMQSRKPTQTGVGLGTPTTGVVAKLWGFELAGYLIRDVEVACCGTTQDTMRMMGSEILSRFTVTFDYPHKQLFLVPNSPYIQPAS
jgi:hypothetical protein